jgi:hypothetical protein
MSERSDLKLESVRSLAPEIGEKYVLNVRLSGAVTVNAGQIAVASGRSGVQRQINTLIVNPNNLVQDLSHTFIPYCPPKGSIHQLCMWHSALCLY